MLELILDDFVLAALASKRSNVLRLYSVFVSRRHTTMTYGQGK